MKCEKRQNARRVPFRLTSACGLILALTVLVATDAVGEHLYVDKVVATVNGEVILLSDVKKHQNPYIRGLFNLNLGIVPVDKWPTEKEILDELVVTKLLEQEASKQGIEIPDKTVEMTIEANRKRNKLSPGQFTLYLAARDVNVPAFKQFMARHLKLQRLIAKEVTNKVPVSEEDYQRYFQKNRDKIDEMYEKLQKVTPALPATEEVKPMIPTEREIYVGGKTRLRQITLELSPNPGEKAIAQLRKKIQTIYQDYAAGADFAKLARKYSQDRFASDGGDLGWMAYNDLIPSLQKVVQRLKVGRVSQPISARNSAIIFYLQDAKNRKKKMVPISEKERKAIEQQWEEMKKRREEMKQKLKDRRAEESREAVKKKKASNTSRNRTDRKKKSLGILSPADEKDYQEARNRVQELLFRSRFDKRMKDWITELKKDSIIETKL